MGLIRFSQEQDGTDVWICQVCGSRFKEKTALVDHLIVNHREEVYMQLKNIKKEWNPSSRTGYDQDDSEE